LTIELPPDLGDLAHDDEPTPRFLSVEVLAVDRHVPSRVRLELPGRTTASDASDAVDAATGAAATAEEGTR
jgi:hypothetical protein